MVASAARGSILEVTAEVEGGGHPFCSGGGRDRSEMELQFCSASVGRVGRGKFDAGSGRVFDDVVTALGQQRKCGGQREREGGRCLSVLWTR